MLLKVAVLLLAIFLGCNLYDNFDTGVLQGKRVLVTGASRGIGEQIAYHYARMGAKVLITARTEAKLQKVVAKCREIGKKDGEYHYIVADMGDLASTERVIQAAIDKFGGLDFLVLNHIVDTVIAPWLSHPQNLTRSGIIIDINFKSFMHLASHALPHLIQSHGSIVIVSSLVGKIPSPFILAYSASKHALHGYFESLREELYIRKKDVSVTMCIIGAIGTESYMEKMSKVGLQRLVESVPLASPEDAGFAIVRGGAMKKETIYFPHLTGRFSLFLQSAFPGILRYIHNNLFEAMSGY